MDTSNELTLLRYANDQLRGRLTRMLKDNLALLEVGLTALRHSPPRIEVMVERAEVVVDAMRDELWHLVS